MVLFNRKHKQLAKCSYRTLQEGYHATEIGLRRACSSGDKKAINKAMKNHKEFESAMLFRSTPKGKNMIAKRYKKTK